MVVQQVNMPPQGMSIDLLPIVAWVPWGVVQFKRPQRAFIPRVTIFGRARAVSGGPASLMGFGTARLAGVIVARLSWQWFMRWRW